MFQPIVISSVCFDSRSLSFHCVISHSLYIQSNHYITRNEDNILLPKYWRENVKQALYWNQNNTLYAQRYTAYVYHGYCSLCWDYLP